MEKEYKKQKINFYYFLCILDIIKKKRKKKIFLRYVVCQDCFGGYHHLYRHG